MEAKDYFEKHRDEFQQPEQIEIQQILVSKEDDAERLLKKLKEGGNFEDLARKFSISPDSNTGGRIKNLIKGTVPTFDFAFKFKLGQISQVVKSNYGFHIVKLR